MKKVSIITSSSYNCMKEKGAFGCVVILEDEKLKLNKCFTNSTGNRIELMAVINALKELQTKYPGEELNIQLSSKLSYLTSAFATSKLRLNLERGESLLNYDLWKLIFEMGVNHKWSIVKINSTALEHLHKIAVNLASNAANNSDGIQDEGVKFSSRKISPKAKAVFDLEEVSSENIIPDTAEQLANSDHGQQLPIIESNDPPF